MIYYVDIDGTICTQEKDYSKARPIVESIAKINDLFMQGHQIVYWTARGGTSGIDWTNVTELQLKSWGCKYDDLVIGTKPDFDFIIDDKALKISDL